MLEPVDMAVGPRLTTMLFSYCQLSQSSEYLRDLNAMQIKMGMGTSWMK